jgi:hypothetical protein
MYVDLTVPTSFRARGTSTGLSDALEVKAALEEPIGSD